MRKFLSPLLLLALLPLSVPLSAADDYAGWIKQMRDEPRGPFSRIRWFCNDGKVLPPQPYACREHGGGVQHGEWNSRTVKLREHGYLVANLLAGIEPQHFLQAADAEDHYAQLLIERYLTAVDEGWIFRKAVFYRGAIQDEDERAGAERLLLALAADPDWLGPRFVALRTGVKLLPHGEDSASISKVRQWSAALSEDDPPFMPIRAKIHGAPDAGDADRVRGYAAGVADGELQQRYAQLASEIDQVYGGRPLETLLRETLARDGLPDALRVELGQVADGWLEANGDAARRLELSGRALAAIRSDLAQAQSVQLRLDLLDLGLQLENAHYRAASELREQLPSRSRQQHLALLAAGAAAAYGTGHINARLYAEVQQQLVALDQSSPALAAYRAGLDYLGRAGGWGVQGMRRYFYPSMMKLAEVEPRAALFIQDQLRGSPLLFYSQLIEILARDAGRLAGIKHQLFDNTRGSGFNALNPGIARGVLYARRPESPGAFRADGIYLLPETVSDLPPVAGIITRGAGNPLSHVQLLARNLGIPNVSVSQDVAEQLERHDGERIVLAVSPGGLVHITADTGPAEASEALQGGIVIRPDLDKLDLSVRRPLPIAELSAGDSGRSVGPKAAKLAELRKHYPAAVSRGLAIPFGLFRSTALGQRHRSGDTLWDWMLSQYSAIAALPAGSPQREERTEAFRTELYTAILNTPLPDSFREQLRKAMIANFGSDSVGVFVRSDTNVEDLAGFTGAGLNLTLPNVVGFEELIHAIPRVWASPFTARAFAWRQAHMTAPEHVYTSVLLLESVGSDKSGVLVTADIDSGDTGILSVAVNEGLGGAVDGQAAESLRISLDGESVRVLDTATAAWRRVPDPAGGILKLPASGSDTIMTPGEIHLLAEFARNLPQRFGPIVDEQGEPAPADVEFGFLDGQLRLFQLRPFLENRSTRGSGVLRAMDASARPVEADRVDLKETPQR